MNKKLMELYTHGLVNDWFDLITGNYEDWYPEWYGDLVDIEECNLYNMSLSGKETLKTTEFKAAKREAKKITKSKLFKVLLDDNNV